MHIENSAKRIGERLSRTRGRSARRLAAGLFPVLMGCSGSSTTTESAGEDTATIASPLPLEAECISPLPEGPIWLRSGPLRASLTIQLQAGVHHLVQFRQTPSAEDLKALSALGIELLGSVPERAFWARVAANAKIDNPASLPIASGIAQAFPVTAAMKLDASLLSWQGGSAAVHWFSDTDPTLRASALKNAKASFVQRNGVTDVVSATLTSLITLAKLDGVQFIEPFVLESRPHSHAGEVAHHASALYAPPYAITGAGRSVALFDAGWADYDHPDLAGRVFFDPSLLSWHGTPIAGSALDAKHWHATHMAGIIASSGAGNPAARGTVPAVDLYSYLFAYDYFEPDAMVASESALHGWRVANHSYGKGYPCAPPNTEPCKSDPRWASYIPDARSTDVWATQSGVLSVYSAGNDGLVKEGHIPEAFDDNWQTIYSGGVAKNALSVCAANPTSGTVEYGVRLDSSKGPASDGRVKPDLCALGNPMATEPTWTTELGGSYVETYATSPAAAEVTGGVAALAEEYARLFPSTPDLPPALARGLLIHTARDMDGNTARWNGFDGTWASAHTSTGPDYTTGWGFMDLGAAFQALVNRDWLASAVQAGRQNDYTISSVLPGQEVRVTLIWDDLPASPGTSRALTSNLDLRVTNLATGGEMLPFVLEPALPANPASHGTNYLDNVEQVRFVNTGRVPADYLVEVLGTDIPRRAQQFVLLSNRVLRRPIAVLDEHRLRQIAEANRLAHAACAGLFLHGPTLELSRRLEVTLPDAPDSPRKTPFVPIQTTPDVHLAPFGIVNANTPAQWANLESALLKAGTTGVVLTQRRSPQNGADAPMAVALMPFGNPVDPETPSRIELSLADLGF